MSQSQRHSHQCIAIATKTGQRCRLRTARGRKCWLHTRRDEKVRIKRSGVPNGGLGLYTTERVRKGQVIARYTGEDLTKEQVDQRYDGVRGQYVYCKSQDHCRDARRTDEPGLGRWVNDARGSGQRPNAKLTKAYSVKARKNIPKGREVLVSYGAQYWR